MQCKGHVELPGVVFCSCGPPSCGVQGACSWLEREQAYGGIPVALGVVAALGVPHCTSFTLGMQLPQRTPACPTSAVLLWLDCRDDRDFEGAAVRQPIIGT